MQEFVERAQRGDLEAFGKLVERFQDAVFGAAYAVLGDFHDAQDLAQESFIRAWSRLEKLRDPNRFPGWLYRITRNCCLDYMRRREGDAVPLSQENVPASDVPTASERLERTEMREAVLDAIRSLSEPNRLATTLFYIDGYSVEEVAEFLEVPPGTVKRRLHDSRKKLRERMVAMVEDELKGSRPGGEFRDRIMREISQVEVRTEKSPQDSGRVLLVDDRGRGLMVFIGKTEEFAIHRALRKEAPPRPLTHELFLSALQAFGITVKEVRITDLRDGTFIGELVLNQEGEERVLDSRPSDAVALALMTGARITVAENVLQEGGARPVSSESDREQMWEAVAMGSSELFNGDLQHLCEGLQQLTDEALAGIVREVGIGTVSLALAGRSEKADQEKPGWRMVFVHPTRRAESREGLPEGLAELLASVWDRIDGVDVPHDEEAMPRTYGTEEAIKARAALCDALAALPGPQ